VPKADHLLRIARFAATVHNQSLLGATGIIRLLARQLPAIRSQLRRLQAAASNAAVAFAAGDIDERGYDLVTARIAKQQELIAVEQLMLEQQVAIATLAGFGCRG
jgi:hypothetical protein